MDDSDNPTDSSPSGSVTPSSSHVSSRRTSSSSMTTATSMSDLSQFMTRSTLTCRRSTLDSRLSVLPPLSNPGSHRRHHVGRRRHSARCPTSSNNNHHAKSHRGGDRGGGVALSRMDSLLGALTDSDSESYRLSSLSSASTATSPSPTLSPTELSIAPTSYFTAIRHQSHPANSLAGSERVGSPRGYPSPPDAMGTAGRGERARGSAGRGLEAVPEARTVERVMKPIKMRRRRKERRKAGQDREYDE